MYIYIYIGNVYSPCLSVWWAKRTSLPIGVWYLVGTVLTKEIDPWKKIPLCAHRAPAARKNVFCSLHKPPENDCFETRTIKISYLSLQNKMIHEKKSCFSRTARPRCAKTCSLTLYNMWSRRSAIERCHSSATAQLYSATKCLLPKILLLRW